MTYLTIYGRSETSTRRAHGRRIDVRPNWKEQPVMPTRLRYD